MWADRTEGKILNNDNEVYPRLYVTDMVANTVHESQRMESIYDGMLLSREYVAKKVAENL